MNSPTLPPDGEPVVGYGQLVELVKSEVRAARVQAARAVNTELVVLYWRIGRLILDRQDAQGWGAGVTGRLAADLRAEFPTMRGLSPRNLAYMRAFAAAFDDGEIVQQTVAQLPWGHVTVLLDKLNDPGERDFYATRAAALRLVAGGADPPHHYGASPPVGGGGDELPGHPGPGVRSDHRDRAGPVQPGLPGPGAGVQRAAPRGRPGGPVDALPGELGEGFAFVGRQYRLTVGEQDFFADLLFFHLGLRRYVVFELKVGAAAPKHLGQLNFYANVVDDLLRRPEHDDGPTIGILLAATRDDVVVEYALRGLDTPLAVSTYTTTASLPDDVRRALPSVEDLTDVVRHARDEPPTVD